MLIREKQIGGQSSYDIVEEIYHATGTKYRIVASLGADAEPENARRRRMAILLDLERSLERLNPLRGADPGIARKCNSLVHRIERERQKITKLTSAIEQMAASAEAPEENRAIPGDGLLPRGNIRRLRLVANDSAAAANKVHPD